MASCTAGYQLATSWLLDGFAEDRWPIHYGPVELNQSIKNRNRSLIYCHLIHAISIALLCSSLAFSSRESFHVLLATFLVLCWVRF